MHIFYLFLASALALMPDNGWGGIVNLNSTETALCIIYSVQQDLEGKCEITCDGEYELEIGILSDDVSYTEIYNCYEKIVIYNADAVVIYSSTPYNLTMTGDKFYFSDDYVCRFGDHIFKGF